MTLNYTRLFDPKQEETASNAERSLADRTPSNTYVYTEEITLAVNVTLATGRPLLIRGQSGSGKSSLARSVAEQLGYAYGETVVTSRTQARDLQWEVDLLLRLQDAQMNKLKDDWKPYVKPGPLWWAFDHESAHRHIESGGGGRVPDAWSRERADNGTVLLIDEIDKADPDVPNNLLKPLGHLAFAVDELGMEVKTECPPVLMLTTNEERDLPPAFLRRCVELAMPAFDEPRLVEVGRRHEPNAPMPLLRRLAQLLREARPNDGPSAAEYLDTVRACMKLDVDPGSEEFDQIRQITLGSRTVR